MRGSHIELLVAVHVREGQTPNKPSAAADSSEFIFSCFCEFVDFSRMLSVTTLVVGSRAHAYWPVLPVCSSSFVGDHPLVIDRPGCMFKLNIV